MPLAAFTRRLSTSARANARALIRREDSGSEPHEENDGSQPLRQLAVRGGAYLVGREAVGMVIRLVGLIITLRLIGPAAYGIFTAAAAFTLVVTTVAQMGGEVFLIKMPGIPDRSHYDQVFTFILATSVLATGLGLAATWVFSGLFRPVGVLLPLRVLLLCVPINVLWAPAQAKIERGFGYRKMGILELAGDFALYATAVPLAFLGAGAWSLVVGYFVWQSWLLVGSYVFAGLRPRLHWSRATARELTQFGFGYSMNTWISLLGGLVNPLVVGRFLGATGVGYVAFAQRLVGTIGFAQRGAYRLGLVAMSKVRDEQKDRLRRALEEGSELQLIALAVPFAIFGLLARQVIPLLFGHQWTPAIRLYTLLALVVVLGSAGFIQATLMLSRGRNYTVALNASIQTVLLAVGSVFLVKHFGIDGFGYASLVMLIGLVYLDRATRRLVSFSYRRYFLFTLALGPLVVFSLVPFPVSLVMLVPLVLFIAVPFSRREGLHQIAVLRTTLSRKSGPAAAEPDENGPVPEGPKENG